MKTIILFLVLVGQAFSVTKYAAQSAAGSNDGSSAGNAYSIAQINAGSPYSPSGDDVVILNGTLTTQLVVPTSGTSGHPITYQFASGAKFSKTYWGSTSSAAIYINGKNYITIDGNGVGMIENTANGGSLANQQLSDGIYIVNSTATIVNNLIIQNIYVHVSGAANVPGGNTLPYGVNCVQAVDSPSLQVIGCTLSNAYTALIYKMTTGTYQVGPKFIGNTVSTCSTGEFIGTTANTQTLDGTVFAYNDVTMGANWYDVADENHIDGYHTATGSSGNFGFMTNTDTYGNYIHGDPSAHCSGFIYYSDQTTGKIYNNLLVGGGYPNHPAQGYIYFNLTGTTTNQVLNNTIVGVATDSSGGIGVDFDGRSITTENVTLKNNIIINCFVAVTDAQNVISWDSDFNTYNNVGSVGYNGSSFLNFAQWKTQTGGDGSSTTNTPNLNGSYFPVPTSGAIGSGTNLSGTFTTGISSGATWPNPSTSVRASPWDMGAYVYSSGASTFTSALLGKSTLKGKATIK